MSIKKIVFSEEVLLRLHLLGYVKVDQTISLTVLKLAQECLSNFFLKITPDNFSENDKKTIMKEMMRLSLIVLFNEKRIGKKLSPEEQKKLASLEENLGFLKFINLNEDEEKNISKELIYLTTQNLGNIQFEMNKLAMSVTECHLTCSTPSSKIESIEKDMLTGQWRIDFGALAFDINKLGSDEIKNHSVSMTMTRNPAGNWVMTHFEIVAAIDEELDFFIDTMGDSIADDQKIWTIKAAPIKTPGLMDVAACMAKFPNKSQEEEDFITALLNYNDPMNKKNDSQHVKKAIETILEENRSGEVLKNMLIVLGARELSRMTKKSQSGDLARAIDFLLMHNVDFKKEPYVFNEEEIPHVLLFVAYISNVVSFKAFIRDVFFNGLMEMSQKIMFFSAIVKKERLLKLFFEEFSEQEIKEMYRKFKYVISVEDEKMLFDFAVLKNDFMKDKKWILENNYPKKISDLQLFLEHLESKKNLSDSGLKLKEMVQDTLNDKFGNHCMKWLSFEERLNSDAFKEVKPQILREIKRVTALSRGHKFISDSVRLSKEDYLKSMMALERFFMSQNFSDENIATLCEFNYYLGSNNPSEINGFIKRISQSEKPEVLAGIYHDFLYENLTFKNKKILLNNEDFIRKISQCNNPDSQKVLADFALLRILGETSGSSKIGRKNKGYINFFDKLTSTKIKLPATKQKIEMYIDALKCVLDPDNRKQLDDKHTYDQVIEALTIIIKSLSREKINKSASVHDFLKKLHAIKFDVECVKFKFKLIDKITRKELREQFAKVKEAFEMWARTNHFNSDELSDEYKNKCNKIFELKRDIDIFDIKKIIQEIYEETMNNAVQSKEELYELIQEKADCIKEAMIILDQSGHELTKEQVEALKDAREFYCRLVYNEQQEKIAESDVVLVDSSGVVEEKGSEQIVITEIPSEKKEAWSYFSTIEIEVDPKLRDKILANKEDLSSDDMIKILKLLGYADGLDYFFLDEEQFDRFLLTEIKGLNENKRTSCFLDVKGHWVLVGFENKNGEFYINYEDSKSPQPILKVENKSPYQSISTIIDEAQKNAYEERLQYVDKQCSNSFGTHFFIKNIEHLRQQRDAKSCGQWVVANYVKNNIKLNEPSDPAIIEWRKQLKDVVLEEKSTEVLSRILSDGYSKAYEKLEGKEFSPEHSKSLLSEARKKLDEIKMRSSQLQKAKKAPLERKEGKEQSLPFFGGSSKSPVSIFSQQELEGDHRPITSSKYE